MPFQQGLQPQGFSPPEACGGKSTLKDTRLVMEVA